MARTAGVDLDRVHALLLLRPHAAGEAIDAALANTPEEDTVRTEGLRVARAIADGRYELAIAGTRARVLLGDACAPSVRDLPSRARLFAATEADGSLLVTLLGAACLHWVVRANFTGPPVQASSDGPGTDQPPGQFSEPWLGASAEARMLLAVDGEDVHRKHTATWALVAARALLPVCVSPPVDADVSCAGSHGTAAAAAMAPATASDRAGAQHEPDVAPGVGEQPGLCDGWAAWWAARAALVHQRLLSGTSLSLHAAAAKGFEAATPAPGVVHGEELCAARLLEVCALHEWFRFPLELERAHAASAAALGLKLELSGELGLRTKFQEKPLAQLCLRAARTSAGAQAAVQEQRPPPARAETLPSQASVDDDVLLEETTRVGGAAAPAEVETAMADQSGHTAAGSLCGGEGAAGEAASAPAGPGRPSSPLVPTDLTVWDQVAVLTAAELARLRLPVSRADERTGSASHDEASLHVRFVLAHPQDWAVQMAALRRLSALDATTKRRQARALAQLEELAAAPDKPEPTVAARVTAAFWAVLSPSRLEVCLDYGRALAGMGSLSDAVRVFESAGAEEEAAVALRAIGESARAEELARAAIADPASATPGLYCLLGDLTGDDTHFERALELAGGRHFRAALALGASATKRGEWPQAEKHLRMALSLRPHAAPVWLHLGMCQLKTKPPRSNEAIESLKRVVNIEPDEAQAWALLGSALSGVPGRAGEAAHSLGRASALLPTDAVLAGRHVRACCEAGDLGGARSALQRLNARGTVPPQSALHRVFQALGGAADNAGASTKRLNPSGDLSADARELAKAAAAMAERRLHAKGDGPETLGMAIFFHQLAGDYRAEATARLNRLERVKATGEWRHDAQRLRELVEEAAQLFEALERVGAPAADTRALQAALRDVRADAEEEHAQAPAMEELRMLMRAVERQVGGSDDDDSD